jgi:predicted nucleotidyltransferase
LEISTGRTDAGDLDVLANLRDVAGRSVDFAELAVRSSHTVIDGVVVRLAALDDVIQSKQFADRPKDRDALPELKRLRDEDS